MESTVAFAVGFTVALGGVIGYLKARSTPSLVAGVGFGTLFGLTGYYIQQQQSSYSTSKGGLQFAALLSVVLAVMMGRRFLRTQKFMPAGLVATISTLSFLYYATKIF